MQVPNNPKGNLQLRERSAWQELILSLREKTGSQILRNIFALPNPEAFVRNLSNVDFYWTLKKIGAEDALSLLEIATTSQWVHVLDMEIWKRDRIDNMALREWFFRFLEAKPERLIQMVFTEEGELLGSFFAYNTIDSISVLKDETYDVPDDYVTLDGTIYFRPKDPDHLDSLTKLFKYMAMTDFQRYFTFMLNYKAIIPSEVEEELYRLRNMRIAEFGFLPFEEAIAIYAPLPPERLLNRSEIPTRIDVESSEQVTLYPLSLIESGKNLVPKFLGRFQDPNLRDRLGIEFASLINQLISADVKMPEDEKDLRDYCLKAVRFLNLAFERILKEGEDTLISLIEQHHLTTLFRVGVYMVMKLKWEFDRWVKGSWFLRKRFDPVFFGEKWGGILKGLMFKRPLYYSPGSEGDYREFEWISELNQVTEELKKIMVLDALFERFEKNYCIIDQKEENDFRPFLFTPFARSILSMDINLEPITKEHMSQLFEHLRKGVKTKPYFIDSFKEHFIRFWFTIASPSEEEASLVLKSTLEEIFTEFQEDYMWVDLKDLDPRYCPHLLVA